MNEAKHTPNIDDLRELAQQLFTLMDDPEPGLLCWRETLYHCIQDIKQFGLSPLDIAATDLLAACEAFLEKWKRQGLSDFQLEKFDGIARQMKTAVVKAKP